MLLVSPRHMIPRIYHDQPLWQLVTLVNSAQTPFLISKYVLHHANLYESSISNPIFPKEAKYGSQLGQIQKERRGLFAIFKLRHSCKPFWRIGFLHWLYLTGKYNHIIAKQLNLSASTCSWWYTGTTCLQCVVPSRFTATSFHLQYLWWQATLLTDRPFFVKPRTLKILVLVVLLFSQKWYVLCRCWSCQIRTESCNGKVMNGHSNFEFDGRAGFQICTSCWSLCFFFNQKPSGANFFPFPLSFTFKTSLLSFWSKYSIIVLLCDSACNTNTTVCRYTTISKQQQQHQQQAAIIQHSITDTVTLSLLTIQLRRWVTDILLPSPPLLYVVSMQYSLGSFRLMKS